LIRAVIDTNVTVSGLLFGGLPLKIIHAALARRFE
jgi:predicted nucleic acid-binding protein